MEYRSLGRSGLQISALSFGAWVTFGNQVDVDAAVAMMGTAFDAGVNFYADLGVMFQGTPKATLTATCGPATPAALCSQLQASTALEAIDLQDSIKNFKYFPVASIGVTIGF